MQLQLCGRFVVAVDGARVEDAISPQGRMLLGYLVLNRDREVERDELLEAIWPLDAPASSVTALRALRFKLRAVLGAERVPRDAFVDVEAARAAIHEAESAVARAAFERAWAAAHVARNIATRQFLAGLEAPWIDEERRALEDVQHRALEALAAAGLGIGGAELLLAERAARALVELSPYRETAHALLIRALAARGNRAEAVLAYDALRVRLREDLGLAPSETLQELHRALVAE